MDIITTSWYHSADFWTMERCTHCQHVTLDDSIHTYTIKCEHTTPKQCCCEDIGFCPYFRSCGCCTFKRDAECLPQRQHCVCFHVYALPTCLLFHLPPHVPKLLIRSVWVCVHSHVFVSIDVYVLVKNSNSINLGLLISTSLGLNVASWSFSSHQFLVSAFFIMSYSGLTCASVFSGIILIVLKHAFPNVNERASRKIKKVQM